MIVKIKCKKCSEYYYMKASTMKDARLKKRMNREGGFVCHICLAYNLHPYSGILCDRYLVQAKKKFL